MKYTELPKQCSACGKPFSQLLRPKRRLQKKAMTLLAIATAVTMAWGIVVTAVFGIVLSRILPYMGLLKVVVLPIFIAIVILPGLFIGLQAMKLPKTVRLKCGGCGQEDAFLVDVRG